MEVGLQSMSSKAALIALGILLVAGGGWWFWSTRPLPINIEMRELQVGDLTRKVRLVFPKGPDGLKQLPLLIALHGALDTTEQMAEYSQLDRLCSQKKIAVAYLEGRNLNWPPSVPEDNPDVFKPDIEFFDAVCDQLISEGIDAQRVHLVGVSQGGCMANALVMERSQRLAAAVINCGWVPKPFDVVPPKTEHKCPLLFIAGSEDQQVNSEVVRLGYELFNMAGHPVKFELLRGAGHGWNANYGVNDLIWKFLQNKENRSVTKPSDLTKD